MFEVFENINTWWTKYGFEILVCISILGILILALCRIGKKGTWSKHYMYGQTHGQTYPVINTHTPIQKTTFESKGEKECRRVLESIFKKPFPNYRPKFLRNPVTGGVHNLEIDCYNEQLRLGCEYSGKFHYEFVPYFHKNKEAFRNTQYRDYMKKVMCRENGTNLIEVPYTIKHHEIEPFIRGKLIKMGYM